MDKTCIQLAIEKKIQYFISENMVHIHIHSKYVQKS